MLKCFCCTGAYSEDYPRYKCDCGGFIVHQYEKTPALEPKTLKNRTPSWWRYREALPLMDDTNMITLGERATPIHQGSLAGEPVHLKFDGACPTGSFKDRGSFLMVSKLKEWGLRSVVEDSSGNAGASVAAYCREADIEANIYAPAYTSPGKLQNIARYGANLKIIEGTREETAEAALRAADKAFYASHNWSPYFAAGVKSLAYELWEQFEYSAPHAVVLPVGGGSSLLGLYYGFLELAETGRIDFLPRLIAVQSTACAPLQEAFARGDLDVAEVKKSDTIAEGIVIARPIKGAAMLKALRHTGGSCLAVTDNETLTALAELGKNGILVEPTSGVGAAGFVKARQRGLIKSGESAVVLLTGKKK